MGANKNYTIVTFDYHLESSRGGEHSIEVQATVQFGNDVERGEGGLPISMKTPASVEAWTMFWKDGKGAFVKMLDPKHLPWGMITEIEEAAISAAYDQE